MKTKQRAALWLAPFVVALGVAGCVPAHPLGLSEAEWRAMSVEDRATALERQAEIDRMNAETRAAAAAARLAEERAAQMELDNRRQSARYGERVQCVLTGAELKKFNDWRAIEPVMLDLVTGLPLPFPVVEEGRTFGQPAQGYAYFDGSTVGLCRTEAEARTRSLACARMMGGHFDYSRGLTDTISSQNFLRGKMRCGFVS